MKKMLLLFVMCWMFSHLYSMDDDFRPGKDYALFFANDNYSDQPNFGNLKNPMKDAKALATELEEMFAFKAVLFENLDRNGIYRELERWQRKSFKEDAQLFVFFSGHGDFNEEENKGFFVPKSGVIDLTSLGNIVANIPCNHILLAIDACYSGTIDQEIAFKGNYDRRPGAQQRVKLNIIKQQLSRKSRLLITSGGKVRTPDGQGHSPFTNAILSGLRSAYVSGDDLFLYNDLLGQLERTNPIPHEGTLKGHDDGGFIFVVEEGALPSKFAAGQKTSKGQNRINLAKEPIDQRPIVEQFSEVSLASRPETDWVIAADGGKYPVVHLEDGSYWIGENIHIKIPGSYCFRDKDKNCETYGRYYSLKMALDVCAQLGEGWVLPSDEDWKSLLKAYGGYYDQDSYQYIGNPGISYHHLGKYGKAKLYLSLAGKWSDAPFTLEIIPSKFKDHGKKGYYWSRTTKLLESGAKQTYILEMKRKEEKKMEIHSVNRSELYSVRCIWNKSN